MKTTFIFITVIFFLFGCNKEGKEQENAQGDQELSKEQVCMVNNAYMGKKQIPVAYDNKTYYGCCEMCVDKIKNNKAIRYATDPYTGKAVDKATAFIALNPTSKDGSVMYFENKESFRNYKAMSLSN